MHLKRIEIRGFKSFADKTELHLAEGITGVVGPNGSGKSNLADAVKWALGEQSIRALRGSRMDELIFSGTKTRRGLGLAEVGLVFANDAGRFPLAYSEIAVTRRVFKSGESEFYLNGAKCRLKDIQDLFLDTGIGKDAYSFIGQGRVEAILSARPEDRRAIFEEVAGIAKYKVRKRETENKLRDAEGSLLRIQDLLYELENESRPLQIEAERASRYLALEEELRQVERDLLLYELNMVNRRAERDRQLLADLQQDLTAKQTKLLQAEAFDEDVRLRALATTQGLERLNAELLQASKLEAELLSEQKLHAGELLHVKTQREAWQERWHSLAEREQDVLLMQKTRAEALDALYEEMTAAEGKQRTCAEELASRQSTDVYAPELERLQGALRQHYEVKNGEISKREVAAAREIYLGQACKEAEDRAREAEEQLEQLKAELAQVVTHRHEAAGLLERQSEKFSEVHGDRESQKALRDRVEQEILALRQSLAVLSSRHSVLQEVTDRLEGYQRSVRSLLQAKAGGATALTGIVGVVGDLLQVEAHLQVALEAALGGSIHYLVTNSEEDAQQGIAWLKDKRAGRATFLPLDVVKPRLPRQDELMAAKAPGAIGFAADLVKYNSSLSNVVGHLLGNILVVDQLSTGVAIARRTGHRMRIVTLEGDVLMPGGSLSGGSRAQQGSGLLGRADELERLAREAGEQTERLARLRQESACLQAGIADFETALSNLTKEREQGQEALNRLLEQEAVLKQSRGELEKRLAEAGRQALGLAEQLALNERQLVAIGSGLATLEAIISGDEAALSRVEQQAGDSLRELQRLDRERHEAELSLALLREQATGGKRELELIERQLAEIGQERAAAEAEQVRLNQVMSEAETNLLRISHALAEQQEAAAHCQARLEAGRQAQEAVNEELDSNRELLHGLREEQAAAAVQQGNVELRLSRQEMEQQHITERLRREFSLTDLSAVYSTLQSRAQGEAKQGELQQALLELGPVRVSAAEESKRLEERIVFLRGQESDVLGSRDALLKLIAEIDGIMAKRFLVAFDQMRVAFSKVFYELFAGGEAEIALEAPDNPLLSGISIMAQPPGKRLQNIDLLSGGEKALTAIALLCASLEVKPTPFCLLDEIDTSLDAANTRRFMGVISRLAADTQFIIVTHSRETMGAVDTLYGVTMPEQGISQLVALDLREVEK